MIERRTITIRGSSIYAALATAWCARYLPQDRFEVLFDRGDALASGPSVLIARPSFRYVLKTLRVSEAELFAQTRSFPIYGVETRLPNRPAFFDSFSLYGRLISGVGFHHAACEHAQRDIHLADLEDFSLSASLARRGLFLPSPAPSQLFAESGYCLDVPALETRLWEQAKRFGARQGRSESGLKLKTDIPSVSSTKTSGSPTRTHAFVVETVSTNGVVLRDCQGEMLSSESVSKTDTPVEYWTETGNIFLGDAAECLPNFGGGRLERLAQDLERFVKFLPLDPIKPGELPIEAIEYNRLTRSVRDRQRDYVSLVGVVGGWANEACLSAQARAKLNLYRARGRFAIFDDEKELKERYLNLMLGAEGSAKERDPMLQAMTAQDIDRALSEIKKDVSAIVAKAPPLSAVLDSLRKSRVA